jgi:TatA/E family protein of Tat protein translocase
MFGALGLSDILFIMVLALLIFGPKRLPEIGRMLGKGLAEFRKASNDLKRSLNAELALAEHNPPAAPHLARVPAETVPAPAAIGTSAAIATPEAIAAPAGVADPGGPAAALAPGMAVPARFSPADGGEAPPYVPLQPYGAAPDPEPAATGAESIAGGESAAASTEPAEASAWPDPFGEPIGAVPAAAPEQGTERFADPRSVEPR